MIIINSNANLNFLNLKIRQFYKRLVLTNIFSAEVKKIKNI